MRAQVIDFELQRQLAPFMRDLQPLPGVYDSDFIAANQGARADSVVKGSKQVMRLPLVSCICSQARMCLISLLRLSARCAPTKAHLGCFHERLKWRL